MLKSLFSKKSANGKGLKLRFSKSEQTWQVLKGYSIMYVGGETECRNYMQNISRN